MDKNQDFFNGRLLRIPKTSVDSTRRKSRPRISRNHLYRNFLLPGIAKLTSPKTIYFPNPPNRFSPTDFPLENS